MSPLRLFDLPNIDRVFSVMMNDCWNRLFALSLCSSKCEEAIKKWARSADLRSFLEAKLMASKSCSISIRSRSQRDNSGFLLFSSRDPCPIEWRRGECWEHKDPARFRLRGVTYQQQFDDYYFFVADPLDEQTVAVFEHVLDLFHLPIRGVEVTLNKTSDADIYLQSGWIKESKKLAFGSGSLPELPGILEDSACKRLDIHGINLGADFEQVIRVDSLNIFEVNGFRITGAILMFLDCKKIQLRVREVLDEHVNLFIEKWLEEPYNQKFQTLIVRDENRSEIRLGNSDILLDGIDSRDVTPPTNNRDYTFCKEIVRGDGRRATLSFCSYQIHPPDMKHIIFEVCDYV